MSTFQEFLKGEADNKNSNTNKEVISESIAKAVAAKLIAKSSSLTRQIKQAKTAEDKLNLLAQQNNVSTAMSLLAVATSGNSKSLLSKITTLLDIR